MSYVELHARSAFSFLEGASVPEELIAAAQALDMPAMALLDRNGFYGSPRFHLSAQKNNVKAHIGAEIQVQCPTSNVQRRNKVQGSKFKVQSPVWDSSSQFSLPVLVCTRTGYQNLCRLITLMKLRVPKHAKPGQCAVTLAELAEHAKGLVCLTGADDGPIARAMQNENDISNAQNIAEHLIEIFGKTNVYAELQRHFTRDEEARNQAVVEIARRLHLPLLATNGVNHASRGQREVADVFTCIRNHVRLETAGRLLAKNSESYLKPAAVMAGIFADLPHAIANTVELSSRLEFTLKDLGYEFPKYPVASGDTMTSFLRQRTEEGARRRYTGRDGKPTYEAARGQIERELKLIEKLKLEGYFLIVWDIVEFCRREGILIQGRGSAANSAVCYSLGITAVDPIGMELLFERFLSEERGEWPDIDLDLPSGDQRERAIQYVYQRYGQLGAAMTANVITYRGRSAAREVGKALGFDDQTLGRLSALVHTWEWKDPKDSTARQFREAGLDIRNPRIKKFFELYQQVQDLPRHLGQHSGGMVICQGQLNSVVPLEPAAMPGRVVVQWDKEDCADLGLIKVDLLGLGMLAAIEECIEIISDAYKEEVDLAHLPQDDALVYESLQKADTIGLFQVESRAQMSCLPRLRPQKFYDIVVQVAIIRPGPIVGNMVHPYLKRRQGRERVVYPHPSLEPVLKRTLGVPLFQEQLLKMAMICADFSGGEAEELRRAFGFKRSEARMREIEVKLRRGMARKGIAQKAQDEIVQSITSFALYGFPESHAASFALIAYASAYLKCHYLAAFTAALLNNQPMGFYQPFTIVKDAQRHGLEVKPVDVMESDWLCTVISPRPNVQCPTSKQSSNDESPRSNVQCPTSKQSSNDESPRSNVQCPTSKQISNDESARSNVQCPTSKQSSKFKVQSSKFQVQSSKFKVQSSNGNRALRLGLRYVKGLREEAGRAIVRAREESPFVSIDDLHRRVPELRKDELRKLAAVGALNFIQPSRQGSKFQVPTAKFQVPISKFQVPSSRFQVQDSNQPAIIDAQTLDVGHWTLDTGTTLDVGHWTLDTGTTLDVRRSTLDIGTTRRDALWQVERVARNAGELYEELNEQDGNSPLPRMTRAERMNADFRGTGLTIGRHPVAYRRHELTQLGATRAIDLQNVKDGSPVKIGGWVIVRQRPGTAKGFVFLTMEDETGVANIIITPQLFDKHRLVVVDEPFLLISGTLQHQDNVVSVKAKNIRALPFQVAAAASHDFH